MTININITSKLQSIIADDYLVRFQDIKDFTNSGLSDLLHIDDDFLRHFKSLIKNKLLNKYSSLNYYLIHQIENLFFIAETLHEYKTNKTLTNEEMSDCEEEVFSFWQSTEFAGSLFEMIENDGANMINSSIELIYLLQNQILAFYYLKIAPENYQNDIKLIYHTISEMGDSQHKIIIGDKHIAEIVDLPETFPSIVIKELSLKNSFIVYECGEDEIVAQIKREDERAEFLKVINTSSESSIVTIKDHISQALKDIEIIDAELIQTLRKLTTTLVLIDDPEIVSFSQQELPGFSSINVFNRDYLDLLDDLLHENGHHFLNLYLNTDELIEEDQDKIFFSPWRKALRPIRGIYHAYCTFYWAYRLYSSLLLNLSKINLNEEQKKKVFLRTFEEKVMLGICEKELERANRLGKILPRGLEVLNSFKAEVSEINDSLDLQKLPEDTQKLIKNFDNEMSTLFSTTVTL